MLPFSALTLPRSIVVFQMVLLSPFPLLFLSSPLPQSLKDRGPEQLVQKLSGTSLVQKLGSQVNKVKMSLRQYITL